MKPDSGHEYLGFKLSIMSLAEMRYEGTLYNINGDNHTVSLSDVRSFGTEGRSASKGKPEIPASDDTYKFVVFKGSDIKDLQVISSDVKQLEDSAVIAVNIDPETVNASFVFGGRNPNHSNNHNNGHHHHNGHHNDHFNTHKNEQRRLQNLDVQIDVNQLKEQCESAFDFTGNQSQYNREEIRKEFEDAAKDSSVYRRRMLTINSGYDSNAGFYDNISNGLNRNRNNNSYHNQNNSAGYNAGNRPVVN